MRRKDHLYETAAFSLAGHQVDAYLSTMDEIELINETLSKIFQELNDNLDRISNPDKYLDRATYDTNSQKERKAEVLEKLRRINEN